jgi:hypothetical protein
VVPKNYEIIIFHEMKNEDIDPPKNPLVYLVGGIVVTKKLLEVIIANNNIMTWGNNMDKRGK